MRDTEELLRGVAGQLMTLDKRGYEELAAQLQLVCEAARLLREVIIPALREFIKNLSALWDEVVDTAMRLPPRPRSRRCSRSLP